MDNAQLRREITTVARTAARNIASDPDALAAVRELRARHGAEGMARVLHAYINERTRYRAEGATQRVRYPRAMLRERVGDCKSTAVFIASKLAAAGVPVVLRYVQTPGRSWYGHVYAYAPGIGPVDPLLPFGTEVAFTRHLDEPVNPHR